MQMQFGGEAAGPFDGDDLGLAFAADGARPDEATRKKHAPSRKAGQAARKGTTPDAVCGDTSVLKSRGGPAVKIRSKHTSLHNPSSPLPVRIEDGKEAAARAAADPDASPGVSINDLERRRRKGSWDGAVQVILPGARCLIMTEAPPRSVTGKIKKHKAETFDLAKLDILIPEHYADEHGTEQMRFVTPTPLQRRSIERALLIETLGNIDPHARENAAYTQQVLDAAVERLLQEYEPHVPGQMRSPEGREGIKDHLRRLLAQGADPEHAMFLAIHSATQYVPRRWVGSAALEARKSQTSAARRLAERRVDAEKRAQDHLSGLEELRTRAAGDRADTQAHRMRRLTEMTGDENGSPDAAEEMRRASRRERDAWLEEKEWHLPALKDAWLAARIDDKGWYGLDEEGRASAGLTATPDLTEYWQTPAGTALRTLTLQRRHISSRDERAARELESDIIRTIATGELNHPGFTLAVALGHGREAEAALRAMTDPEQIRIVERSSASVDARLAAGRKLDEIERNPAKAAREHLGVVLGQVEANPHLLRQPEMQQRMLAAATAATVIADYPDRVADLTLARARQTATAAYAALQNADFSWEQCVMKAIEATGRDPDPLPRPYGGDDGYPTFTDPGKARLALAGLLMQQLAPDETDLQARPGVPRERAPNQWRPGMSDAEIASLRAEMAEEEAERKKLEWDRWQHTKEIMAAIEKERLRPYSELSPSEKREADRRQAREDAAFLRKLEQSRKKAGRRPAT